MTTDPKILTKLGTPKPEQFTADELKTMTEDQIALALEQGQLADLMAGDHQ